MGFCNQHHQQEQGCQSARGAAGGGMRQHTTAAAAHRDTRRMAARGQVRMLLLHRLEQSQLHNCRWSCCRHKLEVEALARRGGSAVRVPRRAAGS